MSATIARRPIHERDRRNADLIERWRRGDNDAFGTLIESSTGLVWTWVRRLAAGMGIRDRDTMEDMASEAVLSIVQGMPGYDESRGGYSTFAVWMIRRGLTRWRAGFDERCRAGGGGACEVLEDVEAQVESVAEVVADSDETDLLGRRLKTIPARERRLLSLRHGLEDGRERTLEEIGREFGVTKERVRQIETKAIGRLRKQYGAQVNHGGTKAEGHHTNGPARGRGSRTMAGSNGTMSGRGHNRITLADLEAKKCPTCGNHLGGPKKSRCYKCSPPGKAKPKAAPAPQPTDDDDDANWPPTRKLGPLAPLPIPAEDREQLKQMLKRLPKNESLVIVYRLGLDGNGRRTQEQAGKLIGYGGTSAAKFEAQAVARLLEQGLDIQPYLGRRSPQPDEPEDVLPLPEGFPTGKKPKASRTSKPAIVDSVSKAPDTAEVEARRLVLRTLLDLPPDAAGRVLSIAAEALGVPLR